MRSVGIGQIRRIRVSIEGRIIGRGGFGGESELGVKSGSGGWVGNGVVIGGEDFGVLRRDRGVGGE